MGRSASLSRRNPALVRAMRKVLAANGVGEANKVQLLEVLRVRRGRVTVRCLHGGRGGLEFTATFLRPGLGSVKPTGL